MDAGTGAGDAAPGTEARWRAWRVALEQAWASYVSGTTPVGAVVVDGTDAVVAAGRGRRLDADGPSGQLWHTRIAHAEVNALAQLAPSRDVAGHVLLTTLEPCAMCHGAIIQSRLERYAFAGPDPYAGTAGAAMATPQGSRRALLVEGPLADARGAFSVMLHVAWLLGPPAIGHVVAEHDAALPALTEFTRGRLASLRALAESGRFEDAFDLAHDAPLGELSKR